MSRLIDHWEQGRFVYLISPAMLKELREVVYWPRLRQHMRIAPAILLELIEADAQMVPGKLDLSGACRDPKDDPFVACAVEGSAAYLVTGDTDLLDMGVYQDVAILRVYDFVHLLDSLSTQ